MGIDVIVLRIHRQVFFEGHCSFALKLEDAQTKSPSQRWVQNQTFRHPTHGFSFNHKIIGPEALLQASPSVLELTFYNRPLPTFAFFVATPLASAKRYQVANFHCAASPTLAPGAAAEAITSVVVVGGSPH
jgi:hypothetical protein